MLLRKYIGCVLSLLLELGTFYKTIPGVTIMLCDPGEDV